MTPDERSARRAAIRAARERAAKATATTGSKQRIWFCKIGEVDSERLPPASDARMRHAVADAYLRLTGQPDDFIFSGWGAELTEPERAVVEDRLPDPELCDDIPALCDDADRYHDLVERVEALRDALRNINIPYFNRRIADRLDKIIAGEPS